MVKDNCQCHGLGQSFSQSDRARVELLFFNVLLVTWGNKNKTLAHILGKITCEFELLVMNIH